MYEIKPLEWKKLGLSRPFLVADAGGYEFRVRRTPERWEYQITPPGKVGEYFSCQDEAHGKQICEGFWISFVEGFLVRV
jgi:hypothetical protein